MTNRPPRRIGPTSYRSIALLLGAFALACTGGSTDTADTGGMSGTGISQGTIDSFGSIFMNDVEWDLSTATVERDGSAAAEGDLRLGMLVTVRGDLDPSGTTGTATSVVFDDEVEGPIEADPVLLPGGMQKSFTVLGRMVVVDSVETVFDDGATFAALARNAVVEVSGLVDGAGTIIATRIELRGVFPTIDDVELEGVVSNLMKNGDGTGIFDLGVVTVEYDGTTSFSGLTEAALMDGDVVEARGMLVGPGTDRIDASEIELEDDFGEQDVDEFEIEGFVSNFVSISDFRVAGLAVDASSDPGMPMLADGDRVEAKGMLVAGALIANEIEFEDEEEDGDVRIDAEIGAIDSLARTITLLGVRIDIDPGARLIDDRDGLPNFGFADLRVDDRVEVRGLRTGTTSARAIRLERTGPEDEIELEGPVTALDSIAHTLEVLGQPIPTDPGTQYFDALGLPRTETQFFEMSGGVELEDIVRVRDDDAASPDTLLEADEVEIESD